MANKDNDSKELEILSIEFKELDGLFNTQKKLQEVTFGEKFDGMTMRELSNYFLFNKHAIEDELSEMMDALGGIKDGVGNAVWKKWKAQNKFMDNWTIETLTPRDRKELLLEIVDVFHFFMNFAIACKFSGSDIANAYYAKNKENIDRQVKGY